MSKRCFIFSHLQEVLKCLICEMIHQLTVVIDVIN